MMYHIITFADGEEMKCPIQSGTEAEIKEHCRALGKEVVSIRQAMVVADDQTVKKASYEVRLSFNEDGQNVSISKDELPLVMWAFLRDSKVVCRNGAFRGKDIISVLPNFNAMMGFNKGYELTPEDFARIQTSELCLEARNYQNAIKELCHGAQSSQELLERSKQLLIN